MENAQLNKAHEHARNAATATYSSSVATAGQEHELAATAFREAAQDTHNDEALRILGLLEDHHLKLAQLIKEPPRKTDKSKDADSQPSDSGKISPPARTSASRTSSPASTRSPTRAPSRRRLPQPAIASNLAEKRGIPGARRGTPPASSVSVTTALATRNDRPSTPVRDLLQRQSRKADEASSRTRDQSPSQASIQPKQRLVAPPQDDNFRRFYSAFEGVISAISAPLAFTSLPLNPTAPSSTTTPNSPEQPPSPTKSKAKSHTESPEASRTIKSSEPDLASLISKPALRALRSDQNGPIGPFANNESFYVVPTSGGTVSYASIVRDPSATPHHISQDPSLSAIAEGPGLRGSSHEEFVDAREDVGPPSPTAPRRPRSKGSGSGSATSSVTNAREIRAGRGNGAKTMEELSLENETLRGLIDKQAKRLNMWETTSQSSYNALAQSIRARGGPGKQTSDPSALAHALAIGAANHSSGLPSPPPVPANPQPEDPAERQKERSRIRELEALLAEKISVNTALASEKEQLARQAEKHAVVIGRYREQWEKLKAGARKKQQERRVAQLKGEEGVGGKGSGSGSEVGTGADGEGDEEVGSLAVEEEEEEAGFGKA